MAELFNPPGDSTPYYVPPPFLQSAYVRAMDNPVRTDGWGVVVPWGGGGTNRTDANTGVGTDSTLDDLLGLLEGNIANYDFEGLQGPRGMTGPPGPQGPAGPGAFSLAGNPFSHTMVSHTTTEDSSFLTGTYGTLESLAVTSRGNTVLITVYASFVNSSSGSMDIDIRIYDVTGSEELFTEMITLTAGQTLYKEYTATHTPGVQENTYAMQAKLIAGSPSASPSPSSSPSPSTSASSGGTGVYANNRGIVLFESYT